MAVVPGVGPSGISPYQVATASGYSGTEGSFNSLLADIGNTSADKVSYAPPHKVKVLTYRAQ